METFTARTDRASCAAAQLLAALPIALFLVTRTATFFTPLILQEGSPLTVNEGSGIYSLCLLASLLVLVAIIVFREKLVPLTENIRLVSIVACALGFIGYLLLFLVRPTEIWSILVFIFGLVATSLYCAIYIIVIGEVLSSFGFRDGLLTVAIIGICLSIIHLLDLALVSKIATSFFIIATPLLIGLLTDFSTRKLGHDLAEHLEAESLPSPPKVSEKSFRIYTVAAAVFCSAAAIYTKFLSEAGVTSVPSDEQALTIYVCLVAFVSLYFILRSTSFSASTLLGLFSFIALLFIGSLIFTIIMNYGGSTWFGTGTIKASQRLFMFFSLVLAIYAVKVYRRPPIVAFSMYGIFIVLLPNILAHGLAVPLNNMMGFYDSDSIIPVTASLALLTLAAAFFVLFLAMRQRNDNNEALNEYRDLKACEEVGRAHGLTEREIEIMHLFYKGHSMKKIAELSYIAPSTVQGHSKKIYAKLGVHSRQELIDMVNSNVKESH